MSAEEIFNKIKFSFEVSENQEDLFTHNHTKFHVEIEYNENKMIFDFQCNTEFEQPEIKSVLFSVFSDAYAYENNPDILDFKDEMGYTDNKICRKFYELCKKESESLHRMFTNEEIELLSNYFNENEY